MTAPLTPDDLAELERLESAATAGPWSTSGTPEHPHWYVASPECLVHGPKLERLPDTVQSNIDRWIADAALIAAARNALPSLIEAARERDRLREAIGDHGLCTCQHTPGYPRGNRHAPDCDHDPVLRAALAETEPGT